MPVDTNVEDVPPIVFVSNYFNAIDQPFKVVETKLNVEDDVSTFYFPHRKKSKCFSTIDYDENSVSFIHPSISSTEDSTLSDDDVSIGNAFSLTHYAVDRDKIKINYHGLKVIPWHETSVTICMANTIGVVHSRCLFRALFDSGSNVCMIKKNQHFCIT